MNIKYSTILLMAALFTACTSSTGPASPAAAKQTDTPPVHGPSQSDEANTDSNEVPKQGTPNANTKPTNANKTPEVIYTMTEIILGGHFVHSVGELTYDKAVVYCGQKGLRLPTAREFSSLAIRFFGAEIRETYSPDTTFSDRYGYWDNLEVQNMVKQDFAPIYKQRTDGSIVLDFFLKTHTYMQLETIDSSFKHGEDLLTGSSFKIPWGTYDKISHVLGWYGNSEENWAYTADTNTMPNLFIRSGFNGALPRGSFICIPQKVAPESKLPSKCSYSDFDRRPAYDFAVLNGYKNCSVKNSAEVADPRENVAALLVRLNCDGGSISIKSYFMKRGGGSKSCDLLSSELVGNLEKATVH